VRWLAPAWRRPLRIGIAILFAAGAAAHVAETRRIGRPLAPPRSAAPGAPGTAAGGPAKGAPRLDAAALLADVETLASPGYEGRRADSDGGRRARAFVLDRFTRVGLEPAVPGYLQPFSFTHRSIRALIRRDRPFVLEFKDAANVLGVVRGRSEPDRFILVSAHYDHLGIRRKDLYPGADDNASGVAALLAFASFFTAHPPAHTILFAAFDAEEEGCRGSEAFAQAPPLPLEGLLLDVNMDMIGRSAPKRLFVAGTRQHPGYLPLLTEAAARSAVALHAGHDRPIWMTGLVDDWTTGSDHRPFFERGLPFLYFGVEDHPGYHAPEDTFDRIDRDFFAGAAETILDVILAIDRSAGPAGGASSASPPGRSG
jgi:hypothetical protein